MQQSGTANQLHTIRRQPHRLGDAERRIGDANGVAEGKGRLGIDDIGEGLADLIDLARFQLMRVPASRSRTACRVSSSRSPGEQFVHSVPRR